MGLKLLIDEDIQSRFLVDLLLKSGHDVLTVNGADISGSPNDEVLKFASLHNRVVVTQNSKDFKELHLYNSKHAGIFAIYREKDLTKKMTHKSVAKAINNIEVSGIKIAGQFFPLNLWLY